MIQKFNLSIRAFQTNGLSNILRVVMTFPLFSSNPVLAWPLSSCVNLSKTLGIGMQALNT